MDAVTWISFLDEGIPLLFLIALGLTIYRGFKMNQGFLSEREELLKRYLLFRGERQVRLKLHQEDERVYRELLKNLSASWKNFKKTYDQYLLSFAQNTAKIKLSLQIITLGLVVNSVRLFVEDYAFSGLRPHLVYTLLKELPSYVLVILSFSLLKMQSHRFLSLKGEAAKMDRELLVYPNNSRDGEEKDTLYNEFDPLGLAGAENDKENQDPHW